MKQTIYLDHMATTPVAPSVASKMAEHLTTEGSYGNASATQYPLGQNAARAITHATEQLAALLNCPSNSLTYTSGATEANNLALQGLAHAYAHKGKQLITVASEHSSVLAPMSALQKQGFSVTYLKPNENGLLDLNTLEQAITSDTLCISVMWVNNEIGVIQDIPAIADLCQQNNLFLHVDAAQAVGKIPVSLAALPLTLLTLSAHKFHGPKGIGALYLNPDSRIRLQPLIYGGGQQNGLRSGTLPTHQIVGLGEAARLATLSITDDTPALQSLQDYALSRIANLPGAIINGDLTSRIPHNIHISLPGIRGEHLAKVLGEQGICVATGSACHASSHQPSHVLRALGRDVDTAQAGLRLSMAATTTERELATTFDCIERYCQEHQHGPS